jgi:mannose-6-phosphate isomerase
MTNTSALPPLEFEPILKEKIWGGDALARRYGKKAPPGSHIGESWEISGFGDDQTICITPECDGMALGDILKQHGPALAGPAEGTAAFPLLYKLIDADERLSVQVHPGDTQAREHGWGGRGKTECWYIIEAKQGAQIICGFKHDVGVAEVRERTADNTLERILNYLEISAGDMLFVPAGTVHAILGGTVLYEVQQSSDTTFRLYDWARVDATGKPRDLHVEHSLAAADTAAHRYHKVRPVEVPFAGGARRLLRAACRYFAVEEYRFPADFTLRLPERKSFQTLMVLEGEMALTAGAVRLNLSKGRSVLIPASTGQPQLAGGNGSRVLVSWIPDLQTDIIDVARESTAGDDAIAALGGNPSKSDLAEALNAAPPGRR